MADLETFVNWFESSEEHSAPARMLAERDRAYYHGDQLTDEERATLKRRGQPPIVVNRIRRKVDYLRGLEIQQRTDPLGVPRTPGHEQGAEAAADAIRYVCDNNDWNTIRSEVDDELLVEGWGGVEVTHRVKKSGDTEITLKRYRADRLFWDPHSSERGFADARYLGAVIWGDIEQLKQQFPKSAAKIDQMAEAEAKSQASLSSAFEDRPRYGVWADTRRKRARLVLIWYREGDKWKWARFVKGDVLDEGESPYVDDEGESVCPLILCDLYIDHKNHRSGVVRDMVDIQDEVNRRRSKALHLLNTRQTWSEKGAVADRARFKAEMAKPDGHVETEGRFGEEWGMLETGDLSAGQVALLQEAKSELDLMGANSALAGDTGESASGRAVQARQRGGLIELAPTQERIDWFTKQVYRAIWFRVRQFWTAEKWIRVTDDEKNTRFVGLNRPVTLAEELQGMPDQEALAVARQMQLTPGDPRLGQVVRVDNPVEQLDVDISIEQAPDMVTLEGEQFDALAQLAASQPGAIPLEMLVETAPALRSEQKSRILEKLQEREAQQAQAAQPMQAIAQQTAAADIAKKAADADLSQARAAKEIAAIAPPIAV